MQKGTKKDVLSENKKPPSSLPPVRNPFKAPGKADKTSEWKKIQEDKGEIKTNEKSVKSENSKRSNDDEIRKKKTEEESDGHRDMSGATAGGGEGMSSAHSESWRDRKLPPGLKIKKRSSNEDKQLHCGSEVTVKGAEATEGSHSDSKREGVNEQQTEKATRSQNPQSHGTGERAAPQQNPKQKTERHSPHLTSRKTSTSNPDTQPSNIPKNTPKTDSQASPGSTLEGVSASVKPVIKSIQKETVKSPFGEWSDDDDDVQLVSVHPASRQTSSVSAAPLQKTLTSYPGFQVMSKGKSQEEDPRTLHNQLTVQLKQKKVLLKCVIGCCFFFF